MKQKFKVEIKEVFSRIVEVGAEDEEEAIEIIEEKCNEDEIDITNLSHPDDCFYRDVTVVDEE